MTEPKIISVTELWRWLYRLIEVAAWTFLVVGVALVSRLPLTGAEQGAVVALAVLLAAFLIAYFHLLLPRFSVHGWIPTLLVIANLAVLACLDYALSQQGARLDLVYALVVALGGVTGGLGLAIASSLLASLASVAAEALTTGFSPWLALAHGAQLVGFLFVGLLASLIYKRTSRAAEDARELALLLAASRTMTASLNLHETLPHLAERVTARLPATWCRVCLLDKQALHLVTYGEYPRRQVDGWHSLLGQRCDLVNLARHREAIQTGLPVTIRQHGSSPPVAEGGCPALNYSGITSACLVPIVFQEKPLGVICVGEARSWKRVPFDQKRVSLLQAVATQVGVIINYSLLHQSTQQQVERTAVLYEVARAAGSTIGTDDLMELINKQLSRVIHAETYCVGLYDPGDQSVNLAVVIDDGRRFPPCRIPAGAGLVSIVASTRRPLLIRQLSEEMEGLPARPVVLGQARLSESWLGVPMMVGDSILGLLAVASYRGNAFDEEDADLLANLATQAALTLDNARNHAELEEQAHRDSLTGVYNHGYFLQRLGEAITKASAKGTPVSLIMLDIDHFKAYNDTYGHVIGDQALCLTVQAIRAHVKTTDTVGRWGGEEFGIVLPTADSDSALRIAQRVRYTLAKLKLSDGQGATLPNPTVSQGIATYPTQAADVDALVSLSDKALYRAKVLGRDQVAVAEL